MDIEFTKDGEAKILMTDYVKEAIEAFLEDCTKSVNTPASQYLFDVDKKCVKINEKDRKNLHSIVAKLLFVAKRARPDTQLLIAFLTSRVTKVDEDDWKKLKRLLEYLQGSLDMPLTLSIDNMIFLKTWIDAAYALHMDMRSHTGGAIMMGMGILYGKSSKQKLNTKSSTEAEVVGASDFLPQTILTRNFIEAQGYKVDDSDFYQDNMSASYDNGKERPLIGRTEIPPHQHPIFLHQGSDCKGRNQSCTLSNWHHDRRFFYETSTRPPLRKIPRHHHGHYPLLNSYRTYNDRAQERVGY
jgi:hypothetical protein